MSQAVVKVVIFTVRNGSLFVLLVDTILPVGTYTAGTLDFIAEAVARKATGRDISDGYVEQLYTVSEKDRISIVYYVLLAGEWLGGKGGSRGQWHDIRNVSDAAPDGEIIRYAVQRLRWKIEYTNVVYSLLSEEFTLSELQRTYEAILGKVLDKRNFRKKISSLGLVEPTGSKKKGNTARPALVYRFKERKPVIVKIFS